MGGTTGIISPTRRFACFLHQILFLSCLGSSVEGLGDLYFKNLRTWKPSSPTWAFNLPWIQKTEKKKQRSWKTVPNHFLQPDSFWSTPTQITLVALFWLLYLPNEKASFLGTRSKHTQRTHAKKGSKLNQLKNEPNWNPKKETSWNTFYSNVKCPARNVTAVYFQKGFRFKNVYLKLWHQKKFIFYHTRHAHLW